MSKQSSRSKISNKLPLIQEPKIQNPSPAPSPALLEVGGFHINIRKLQSYAPENKSSLTSTRKKSHKSLGTNISDKISVASFKVRQRKKVISTEGLQKSQPKEQPNLEEFQQSSKQKQQILEKEIELQPLKEEKELEFHFKEKKMKIGRKVKTDLMKQFILETLQKGKAEGNCLTINKGTAQCDYSPKREEEKPKHENKERYPLVLVQQKSQGRLSGNRVPLPQNNLRNRPRPPQNNSEPKSSVRLPSIRHTNKWVAIARKMQKNEKKQDPIVEEIEAEEKESQKKEEEAQVIPEQIQK